MYVYSRCQQCMHICTWICAYSGAPRLQTTIYVVMCVWIHVYSVAHIYICCHTQSPPTRMVDGAYKHVLGATERAFPVSRQNFMERKRFVGDSDIQTRPKIHHRDPYIFIIISRSRTSRFETPPQRPLNSRRALAPPLQTTIYAAHI